LCPVTVFHGEAGTVERQPDATPCALEPFADLHDWLAVHSGNARGLDWRSGRDQQLRLLLRCTELDHQAPQELCFELRVDGAGLPRGLVFLCGAVDFRHAAMADVNFGRTVGRALQTGAKLVELAGRINRVDELAQRAANNVLRQLGTVLGPIGFQDAEVALVERQQETVFQPEIANRLPQLLSRPPDHDPALRAGAFHPDIAKRADGGRDARRIARACLITVGRDRAAGRAVAAVTRQLRQVGRHFQAGRLAGALVVDFVAFQRGTGGQADDKGQQGTSQDRFQLRLPWIGSVNGWR